MGPAACALQVFATDEAGQVQSRRALPRTPEAGDPG
jgi:hypothetical protein